MSKKSNFFSNVYVPNLTTEQKKIVRDAPMPKTFEEIQEEVQGKLDEVTDFFNDMGVGALVDHEPRILTKKEAESVMEARLRMIEDTKRIKKKLDDFDKAIDLEIGEKGFDYSFKRKPRLKKAMKAITGKNKTTITYEDYKLALQIKRKLEEQEMQDLTDVKSEEA